MNFLLIFLQIGELFNGKFTWRGVFHLFIFVLMGVIIGSFSLWIIYQTFRSGKNTKK